jgi:hypothetical protein
MKIPTISEFIILKFLQKRNINNFSRYLSINNIRSSDKFISLFKSKRSFTRFVSSTVHSSYNYNKRKHKLKPQYALISNFSSFINEYIEKPPYNNFKDLLNISPHFLLNGEQIRLLQEPKEFYEELKVINYASSFNLQMFSNFIIFFFYIVPNTYCQRADFYSCIVHWL